MSSTLLFSVKITASYLFANFLRTSWGPRWAKGNFQSIKQKDEFYKHFATILYLFHTLKGAWIVYKSFPSLISMKLFCEFEFSSENFIITSIFKRESYFHFNVTHLTFIMLISRWEQIACLHDQNKNGFFGGPAFIQPIRTI